MASLKMFINLNNKDFPSNTWFFSSDKRKTTSTLSLVFTTCGLFLSNCRPYTGFSITKLVKDLKGIRTFIKTSNQAENTLDI